MIKHVIRQGPLGRTYSTVDLTRGRAIHLFCIECCGYQVNEVRLCPDGHCPLYPYRLGTIDPQFVDDGEVSTIDSADENDENSPRVP